MSGERREVRPFDTLDVSERLMRDGVQVVAFASSTADEDLSNAFHGQALQVSDDLYRHEEFRLFLFRHVADNANLVAEMAREVRAMYRFDPSIVHLVVQIHNKRLRMTDVVFDEPVVGGDELPHSIVLAEKDRTGKLPRPRPLQTPGDGCEVVVELLLSRDVPEDQRRPGVAWRKGSWLARVAIRIATGHSGGGPSPLPLTAEIREQFDVPPNAQHYVRRIASGESILRKAAFNEVVEFYVDEHVLRAVVEDPHTPASKLIQLRWILTCIDGVLAMAMAEREFEEFDPEGDNVNSVIRAILDRVVDGGGVRDVRGALELLKQDRGLFMAMLEDSAELAVRERALLGLEAS